MNDVMTASAKCLLEYRLFKLRVGAALALREEHLCLHPNELNVGSCLTLFDGIFGCMPEDIVELSKDTLRKWVNDNMEVLLRYPLIFYEILLCLGCADIRSLVGAIKVHPQLTSLIREYVNPYSSHVQISDINKRRKRMKELLDHITLERLKQQLYFSPLIQISIGHYSRIIDTLCTVRANCNVNPIITFYHGSSELGLSLAEDISHRRLASIRMLHHSGVLNTSVTELERVYDCDYYVDGLSFSSNGFEPNLVFKPLATKAERKNGSVIIHLRTASYKNDGSSPHASLRNVTPHRYRQLLDIIQTECDSPPLQITAESSPPIADFPSLIVDTKKQEERQWQEIVRSPLFVGTASGISHLSNLGAGKIIVTNSNGLAVDCPYSEHHLFACKRFSLRNDRTSQLDKNSLLTMVIYPWEMNNGLAENSCVTELLPDDIVEAFRQFNSPDIDRYTLHRIFRESSLDFLCDIYQDRNLSYTTYADIASALLLL
jgi:hypothetical protein